MGAQLSSLAGLKSLTSVGGDVDIDNNPGLLTFASLESVGEVDGSVKIEKGDILLYTLLDPSPAEYAFLVDDAAVDAFTQVILESGGVFEGDLEISENVTSLKGLEGLTSVGGYLGIGSNAKLTSLSGLEGLASVGGGIYIWDNTQMTSLAGLHGLITVGGNLNIEDNAQLSSLAGLEGLTSVGGDLKIED